MVNTSYCVTCCSIWIHWRYVHISMYTHTHTHTCTHMHTHVHTCIHMCTHTHTHTHTHMHTHVHTHTHVYTHSHMGDCLRQRYLVPLYHGWSPLHLWRPQSTSHDLAKGHGWNCALVLLQRSQSVKLSNVRLHSKCKQHSCSI